MDLLEISGWLRLERWMVRKRTARMWLLREQEIPASRKPREAGRSLDWSRRLERQPSWRKSRRDQAHAEGTARPVCRKKWACRALRSGSELQRAEGLAPAQVR